MFADNVYIIHDMHAGTLTETSVQELDQQQHSLLSKTNAVPSGLIIHSCINYSYMLLCLMHTGFGQRHKTFQNVLCVARERKFLISTKARYAGMLCPYKSLIKVIVLILLIRSLYVF